MAKDTVHFVVDSQLMTELGDRLVSKNYIALAELIKNSYDADAKKVEIIFREATLDTKGGSIEIKDDGHGMSFDQVKNKWMRIATDNKSREKVSPKFGRPRTGNKGIGRLACQRLAEQLLLETIGKNNKDEYEKTSIDFKWKRFKPGEILTKVKFNTEVVPEKNTETGTKLILYNLRDTWSDSNFNILRRHILQLSLAKDIKRKKYGIDPGMKIFFDAPEFTKTPITAVDEEFYKAGWGTITGKVDDEGNSIIKLTAKDMREKIYSFEEPFPLLKNVSFEIAWVSARHSRNETLLKKWNTDDIKEYSGVKVYYNSFRVYPYGQGGDDWLGLDEDQARSLGPVNKILGKVADEIVTDQKYRSKPLLQLPKNQNLFGSINIDGSSCPDFIIKMDREGFVDNEAYSQIKKLVRLSIEWATLYYCSYLVMLANKVSKEKEEEFEEKTKTQNVSFEGNDEKTVVTNAVSFLKGIVDENVHPEDSSTQKVVDLAEEVILNSFDKKDMLISLLRNIATVNSIMVGFAHESRYLVDVLSRNSKEIEGIIEDVPKNKRKSFEDLAVTLKETSDRLEQQLELFNILGKKRQNLTKYKLPVKQLIQKAIGAFSFIVDECSINIKSSIDEDILSPKMSEAEFYTVIINLISNALKAVLAADEQKDILIESYYEKKDFVLRVCDKGVGLKPKSRQIVFEPLEADPDGNLYKNLAKRDKHQIFAFGQGTGLGLSIVKDIVEAYSGSIEFIDAKKPWITTIEVRINEKS